MARRRSARYYRENPLSNTELIIGGLVGVAVLGIGGYLLYEHYNGSSAALPAGSTSAGGVSSVSTDSSGNTLINGYEVSPSGAMTATS